MSFILDALKKSESDRQRQGGPALFEVKVAAPRRALPLWAIAIAVLFAGNLGVGLWLLVRHAAGPPPVLAPPASPAPVAAAAHPQTPVEPVALVSAPAAANPPPAQAAGATGASGSAQSVAPVAAEAPGPATAPALSDGGGPTLNPDDYAPADEAPAASGAGSVRRGTAAGVPLYQQLAASPGKPLPQLHLDLLAYAERPADRWVLINMHKAHEGESLAEGVRVERITSGGAVLSYQGSQFLLTQ